MEHVPTKLTTCNYRSFFGVHNSFAIKWAAKTMNKSDNNMFLIYIDTIWVHGKNGKHLPMNSCLETNISLLGRFWIFFTSLETNDKSPSSEAISCTMISLYYGHFMDFELILRFSEHARTHPISKEKQNKVK